jgi:hypothetical protein
MQFHKPLHQFLIAHHRSSSPQLIPLHYPSFFHYAQLTVTNSSRPYPELPYFLPPPYAPPSTPRNPRGTHQGPCAIPPKQGQSQLISPVSGLKAPCCPASSSNAPIPPSCSAGASIVSSIADSTAFVGVVCATSVLVSLLDKISSIRDGGRSSSGWRVGGCFSTTVGRQYCSSLEFPVRTRRPPDLSDFPRIRRTWSDFVKLSQQGGMERGETGGGMTGDGGLDSVHFGSCAKTAEVE